MKKFSKNLRYLTLSLSIIIGIFVNSGQASATWTYTPPHDIPYVVVAGNVSPSCNAGIDRSITLPTNSIAIPAGGATVTDSDGTVASTVWSQVGSTPSTATITNGSTLTPTFSNLIQGVYTFRLTGTDNLGATCTDDMTVTVNPAGNLAPTANAGPDQTITLPSNSVSISGTGSDPDGTITLYAWTKVSGGTAIITPTSSTTTGSVSITNLAQGSYTFRLTVTDNGSPGLTGSDDMNVTVNPAPPPTATGSLTVNPNTCTIGLGASTCSVTGATWTTSNANSPKLVDGNTNTTLSTLANNATPLQVWVAYPSTVFKLMDGDPISGTQLDTKTATANCGANSWNGTMCVLTPVNGVCGATHFNCVAGTSINNSGTGPWTWQCQGSNGGSTASCSESLITQCNDGVDNDGDGLIDFGPSPTNDPGCSSASDNTEKNNPKIKEIEL